MRKSLLIAAMASLAFVGCTESELDQTVSTQQAIKFNVPVVRPNTKAAQEVGTIFDIDNDFRVWGTWFSEEYTSFAQGKMYINEAIAEYDATGQTWYPNNNGNYYYWPKNGTITFSAYSPASDKMTTAAEITANGILLNDYVVDNVQPNNDMEDVLFSERAYNKLESTGTTNPYKGVDIQFHHALSSVLFTAKVGDDYPGTTVKIYEISLSNVASKASFNQNLKDGDGITTKLPNGAGTSDTEAAWTGQSNEVVYKVDNAVKTLVNNASPWYFCTADGTAPEYFGTNNSNNYRYSDFIMIPQYLEDVVLTINYTIKSPDSVELPQQYTHTFTAADVWKIGYRYIYNIIFDFDPITLAPMVSVFVDADPTTDLDVPQQN